MKNKKCIPLELYIHIPFCVQKCQYCDFLSGPSDQEARKRYIEALLAEIQAVQGVEAYASGRKCRDSAEGVYECTEVR